MTNFFEQMSSNRLRTKSASKFLLFGKIIKFEKTTTKTVKFFFKIEIKVVIMKESLSKFPKKFHNYKKLHLHKDLKKCRYLL